MPFGVEKVALLGAAGSGGAGEMTGGSRNDSQGDGYIYEVFTSSGTASVSGNMTVDGIVVGGGAGWDYGQTGSWYYHGGGGGGGFLSFTGLEITAGDYTVTIGALGSNGSGSGNNGTNGGTSHITIGGVLLSGGGGGRGGKGGTGYGFTNGTAGVDALTSTSPNRGSGGGGGGAGVWNGNNGGTGLGGGSAATGGTPSSGTFTTSAGGSGATTQWYSNYGGGGGNGHGGSGIVGYGYQGTAWNTYPTADDFYGQGASPYGGGNNGTTTPNSKLITDGKEGRGSAASTDTGNGDGNAGIIIFRWAA